MLELTETIAIESWDGSLREIPTEELQMKPTDEQVAQAWWEVVNQMMVAAKPKSATYATPWESLSEHRREAMTRTAHVMRELIVDTDAGDTLDALQYKIRMTQ